MLLCCSGGCFAAVVDGWSSLLADALPPLLVGQVVALPPFCVVDLRVFGGVVFFCRFSYVVLARCLEFGFVSSSVVLAWSSATFLVVLCVRLNSLCLLRFVMVVLLSS